jgi:hypothetical protein
MSDEPVSPAGPAALPAPQGPSVEERLNALEQNMGRFGQALDRIVNALEQRGPASAAQQGGLGGMAQQALSMAKELGLVGGEQVGAMDDLYKQVGKQVVGKTVDSVMRRVVKEIGGETVAHVVSKV